MTISMCYRADGEFLAVIHKTAGPCGILTRLGVKRGPLAAFLFLFWRQS